MKRFIQMLSTLFSRLRSTPTIYVEFKDEKMWNDYGTSKRGRSPLSDKIEAAGARPGEKVQVDVDDNARVIGRKPEVAIDNTRSTEKTLRLVR